MNLLFWIVLPLVGAALLVWGLYRLLRYVAVRGILRSYRRMPERVREEFGYSHPDDLNLVSEELAVEVEPDLRLKGFLMRTSAPRRGLLVYHHGIWDAARPRLSLAARMVPEGFDCLMYDSRGHGESEGRYCTYGKKESADLIRFLDVLELRGVDTSATAVVGHSMGAATAVYAAMRDPRICALVLEACYRDLPTAVRDYARLFVPMLPQAIIDRALDIAAARGDFDPAELSPRNLMPRLAIPVLFVQGTFDRRIKPHYAQEHYDAKMEPREIYWIQGAHHGRVWREGGREYTEKLAEWLCAQMPVRTKAPR